MTAYSENNVLKYAFYPDSIAIVGASEAPYSAGYIFMYPLLEYGYQGHIYPVNPNKQTVLGRKAYPDLGSIPGSVDYAICCLPASKVINMLRECHAKGVKVVHLFTARFSETGRQEDKELEINIMQEAKRLEVRLIGPNCMGIYHPQHGMAFAHDLPKESGTVGVVFQSGGMSTLIARYGQLQGLRFSKVISYGNALDLDESDFLHYLAHDDKTKVIAAYIEGVKNGRKLLNALSDAARIKPVVAIKAGRNVSGIRAAASHTAAIAGSDSAWDTIFKQAGVIRAQDMEELIDLLVTFSILPPISGNRVGIVGGGGGTSVMSADACEEAGFVLPPLPVKVDEELEKWAPELQGWLGNPVDRSIMPGASGGDSSGFGSILRMVAESSSFDFIITQIAEDNPSPENVWESIVRGEIKEIIDASREQLKPIVTVINGGKKAVFDQNGSDRWKILAELRESLIAARIPTYSTVTEALSAIRQSIDYWQSK